MSTSIRIRLESEALAARNAARVSRCDAAVNVLFAVLAAIGGAVLLVHFGVAEGLW